MHAVERCENGNGICPLVFAHTCEVNISDVSEDFLEWNESCEARIVCEDLAIVVLIEVAFHMNGGVFECSIYKVTLGNVIVKGMVIKRELRCGRKNKQNSLVINRHLHLVTILSDNKVYNVGRPCTNGGIEYTADDVIANVLGDYDISVPVRHPRNAVGQLFGECCVNLCELHGCVSNPYRNRYVIFLK